MFLSFADSIFDSDKVFHIWGNYLDDISSTFACQRDEVEF